jgi:hypothetical protein
MLRGLFVCVLLAASTACAQHITVPFVGCPSDGQLGPQPAPKSSTKRPNLNASAAPGLAYYQIQDGTGVLGPQGWHCFGTYGSSGSTIFVSPNEIDSKALFSDGWKGFEWPVVELSEMLGGTSGRWAVGSMIARVFPAYKGFIVKMQQMGFDPSTTHFPSGPFPGDRLHYLNQHVVEYTTPPHSTGIGTMSGLRPDPLPITGVQILNGADTDLISLSVRLPTPLDNLAPVITRQVERENTSAPLRP